MKTLDYFKKTVWFFNHEGQIESSTYASFLNEYWSDETTSPRGVEHREQIASFIIEDGDIIEWAFSNHTLIPSEGQELKFGVRSWGVGGPSKLVSDLFDTEEEAEARILEGMEYDCRNSNCNRPTPYFSESEILEVQNES